MIQAFLLHLRVFRICRRILLKFRRESVRMMDLLEAPWWLSSTGIQGTCCPSTLTARHSAPLSGLYPRRWQWSVSLSWWGDNSYAAPCPCSSCSSRRYWASSGQWDNLTDLDQIRHVRYSEDLLSQLIWWLENSYSDFCFSVKRYHVRYQTDNKSFTN